MDIVNFDALKAQGRIIDPSQVDPNEDYFIIGKYTKHYTTNSYKYTDYPVYAIKAGDVFSQPINLGPGIYDYSVNEVTSTVATRRYLVVDPSLGNDTLAASDIYNRPFATINGAINQAGINDVVLINPGDHVITTTLYNKGKVQIHALAGANISITATYWFIQNGGSGGVAPEIIITGDGVFKFNIGFYRNYGSVHTNAKIYLFGQLIEAGILGFTYLPSWLEDNTNNKQIVIKAETFTQYGAGTSLIYSESNNDYVSFHINDICSVTNNIVNTYSGGLNTIIDVRADQIILDNKNINFTCLIYIGQNAKVDINANLITAKCGGSNNGVFHNIAGDRTLMNINANVKLLKGYLTGVFGDNTVNFYKQIELINDSVPNTAVIYNSGGFVTFYSKVISDGQFINIYGGRTEFLGLVELLGTTPKQVDVNNAGAIAIINQITFKTGISLRVRNNGKLYLNKDVIGSINGPLISLEGNAYLDVKACKVENLDANTTSVAVRSTASTDKIISSNARFIVNNASTYSVQYTLGSEATLYSYGGTYQNKISDNTPVVIGEAVTVNANII